MEEGVRGRGCCEQSGIIWIWETSAATTATTYTHSEAITKPSGKTELGKSKPLV